MKVKETLQIICLAAFFLTLRVFQKLSHLADDQMPSSRLSSDHHLDASQEPAHNSTRTGLHATETLSLYPGELPGYTGWARPAFTLAPYFQISQSSDYTIRSSSRWRVHFKCLHEKCRHGGAHFFVRLYGPAILSGQVHDYKNGSYSAHAWPDVPGLYTAEIVLVVSNAPHWSKFPLPVDKEEPGYEGYMIPGFPRQLYVLPSLENASSSVDRICGKEDLISSNATEGPRTGPRWVIKDKMDSQSHILQTNIALDKSTLEGYRHGENSLGIWMEYRPRSCSLLPLPKPESHRNPHECLRASEKHPIHFIFVGDSVTRMQKQAFEKMVNQSSLVRITHVSTKSGLSFIMEDVKRRLIQLYQEAPNERRFVLFNSGLHDLHRLCTQKWQKTRSKKIAEADEDFSCSKEYRRLLASFIKFMSKYPAELHVFETTSAGWPKYGNFGFAWPPNMTQPFPYSPNFCHHWNTIAFNVLRDLKLPNILVLDGYWVTHARPDNRWSSKVNAIADKLIHPGKEVINGMVQMYWTLLLMATSPDCASKRI